MGVHLSYYISSKVTVEEVHAWLYDKAFDIIEIPTPEAKEMISRVNKNRKSWCHGMKCATSTLDFLVGRSHVIDEALIQRVIEACKRDDCPLNGTDEVLRGHIGSLIWAWCE